MSLAQLQQSSSRSSQTSMTQYHPLFLRRLPPLALRSLVSNSFQWSTVYMKTVNWIVDSFSQNDLWLELSGFRLVNLHNDSSPLFLSWICLHHSSCRHRSVIFSQSYESWLQYMNKNICRGQNGTPYHSMVRLRVGVFALFSKGRGNAAAIIMVSHADAKAHLMSSAAQYGLRNFFCDRKGPP